MKRVRCPQCRARFLIVPPELLERTLEGYWHDQCHFCKQGFIPLRRTPFRDVLDELLHLQEQNPQG